MEMLTIKKPCSIAASGVGSWQSGIALIEVTVAVLILSIGVLGLTSLQLSAKRAGFEAVQRTAAASFANDIIERMRNNPENLALYDGQTVGGASIGTPPSPDCTTASCTGSQMAARDLWEWEQAIDGANETRSGNAVGGLNSPTGCIDTTVGATAGRIEVTLSWEGYTTLSKVNDANTCGDEDSFNRQLLVVQSFITDE